MIKVIYNSPAIPQYPYDVKLNMSYECIKDGKKYFIKGLNFNREFSLEFIKNTFKPCNGYSWNMLEEINKNATSQKKKK